MAMLRHVAQLDRPVVTADLEERAMIDVGSPPAVLVVDALHQLGLGVVERLDLRVRVGVWARVRVRVRLLWRWVVLQGFGVVERLDLE